VNVLITGVMGFIGSTLAAELTQQGHSVYGVDQVSGFAQFDPRLRYLAQYQLADYVDADQFYGHWPWNPDLIDFVVHLGADSSTNSSSAQRVLVNNVQPAQQLLEWAQRCEIPVIAASSASVYGNNQPDPQPLTPYAWGKLLVDQWSQHNLRYNSWWNLRFFNVYGANEAHKSGQQSPIYRWARGVDGSYEIKQDYWRRAIARDFVHVNDCVSVMCWLMQNQPSPGIIDVGSGTSHSFQEVFDQIQHKHSGHMSCRKSDMTLEQSHVYQCVTQADLSGLRSRGYQRSFIDLDQGIDLMLDHHQTNNQGLT
jgi:ADP-L-glycero-D-manno-heptose 6-epimerase